MSDYLIRTGDTIRITIASPAVVPALLAPVPLRGSGTLLVAGAAACLAGDELPLRLRVPLTYTAPPFDIPGTGTLSLTLGPANLTRQTLNGRAILLKGQAFVALLTVATPAQKPVSTGTVPDPLLSKPGTARFLTGNATVVAG